MGVYIKGFEMPNYCGACPLRLAWCRERIYMETRPPRCPLLPVPDHGDLIDRGKLIALWEQDIVVDKKKGITDYAYTDKEMIYREFIEDAKNFRAVIPAERSEDE